MKTDIGIWQIDPSSEAGSKLDLTERVETEEMLEGARPRSGGGLAG